MCPGVSARVCVRARAVSPTVLEGAIRCGCTHLIVDVLLSEDERQQLATAPRLVAAVQHMRSPGSWRTPSGAPAMVVSRPAALPASNLCSAGCAPAVACTTCCACFDWTNAPQPFCAGLPTLPARRLPARLLVSSRALQPLSQSTL